MKKLIITLLLILLSFMVSAQCNSVQPEIVIFSDDSTKPSRISFCEDSTDFLLIQQYNLPTEDYLSTKDNPLFIEGDENLHLKLKLYKSEYYTTENGNKECYYYYKITKFNLNQIVTKQINYIVIYYDYQVITNELDFKKSIELNYLIETYYKYKKWKLPK
jgi:hypothetical protein